MKGGGGRAAGTGTAPASKCTVRTLRSCHLPQITTRPSLGNHLSGPRPAPGPQEIWPDLRPPTYNVRPKVAAPPAPVHRRGRLPAGLTGPWQTARGQPRKVPEPAPRCPRAPRRGGAAPGAPRRSSRPQSREPSPEAQEPRAPAGNHSNRQGPRSGGPCHCPAPRVPR